MYNRQERRIKYGKLIEGLWDCPFCDNKRIKAGQKTCPLCGHPQDENTKFYMPDAIEYVSEEKAAKISRNPDWQCSFCGSLNSDDLNICKNCGATKEDSERNYFEIRKQEEEKKNEALTNAEKARVAAEERALLAETKVTCLSKGVASTSVDDVVILAKSMLNDDLTMEQAIDKVLEKYPSFKGEQQKQEQNKNGFIIGANNTKQKVNPNDAIARAFGIK